MSINTYIFRANSSLQRKLFLIGPDHVVPEVDTYGLCGQLWLGIHTSHCALMMIRLGQESIVTFFILLSVVIVRAFAVVLGFSNFPGSITCFHHHPATGLLE